MEGCGIPPKRAGQHRQEVSNYTCHRIPHSGFPLWQGEKKTKKLQSKFYLLPSEKKNHNLVM